MMMMMNEHSQSPSQLDDMLVEFRERHLDVLLLCETWHDADSVSIRRLRADGFTVVERAWPRSSVAETSLGVNHAALPSLLPLASERQPSTSTYSISSSTSCYFVVVVYRSGSSAVTADFFTVLFLKPDRKTARTTAHPNCCRQAYVCTTVRKHDHARSECPLLQVFKMRSWWDG